MGEATLSHIPSAEAGYHALAFIIYKVISPLRHGLSLAVSSVVVVTLEKTWPGYLKTSGDLAKESRKRVERAKEKYEEAWKMFADQKVKEKFGDKQEEIRDDVARLKQKFKNK